MTTQHKALELAERLKTEGDIQADAQIQEMHALIAQMRNAMLIGDGFLKALDAADKYLGEKG
jgi:hypothetical protein